MLLPKSLPDWETLKMGVGGHMHICTDTWTHTHMYINLYKTLELLPNKLSHWPHKYLELVLQKKKSVTLNVVRKRQSDFKNPTCRSKNTVLLNYFIMYFTPFYCISYISFLLQWKFQFLADKKNKKLTNKINKFKAVCVFLQSASTYIFSSQSSDSDEREREYVTSLK